MVIEGELLVNQRFLNHSLQIVTTGLGSFTMVLLMVILWTVTLLASSWMFTFSVAPFLAKYLVSMVLIFRTFFCCPILESNDSGCLSHGLANTASNPEGRRNRDHQAIW